MRRPVLALVCALVVACGGEGADVRKAERALARWELERAEDLVSAYASPAADALRARVLAQRAKRVAIESQVQAVLERVPEATEDELLDELRRMRRKLEDPHAVESVESGMSRLVERFALQRRERKSRDKSARSPACQTASIAASPCKGSKSATPVA